MSHVLRNPAFCICENTGADQLSGNRATDQRFCFRYVDTVAPVLVATSIKQAPVLSKHFNVPPIDFTCKWTCIKQAPV